jgi:hypothetical protein
MHIEKTLLVFSSPCPLVFPCLCGKSNGFFFGHSNPVTVLHIVSPD